MSGWQEIFAFNRQERRGVFFLLLIIFALQGLYFLLQGGYIDSREATFVPDKETIRFLDSLDLAASEAERNKWYRFNPNYLDEFRGYSLGMTAGELDRLYAFRKNNRLLASAAEFQAVTGVSDSLLGVLAPRFLFPGQPKKISPGVKGPTGSGFRTEMPVRDLNKATALELRQIKGIGEVLSGRIIKFREALCGFQEGSQLYDVYGLDAEVVQRTLQSFIVKDPPEITPVNVNTASAEELAQLVYISFPVAKAIVQYREKVGNIGSFDEISGLEGFPSDKIDRIKLYLRL